MNNQKDLIDYLHQRLDRIENKVDNLLEFKWQIVGGSVLLSLFLTVLMQVYFK